MTRWLLAALLSMSFWSAAASSEDGRWQGFIDNAVEAFVDGDYVEAGGWIDAAVKRAESLGPQDPRLGTSLNNLGLTYKTRGQFGKAELLFRGALRVYKKALGPAHPHVAAILSNLATLYGSQGKHAEAESLHKQALVIAEDALGPDHLDVGAILDNYADLLRKTGRYEETTAMEVRANAIRAKQAK